MILHIAPLPVNRAYATWTEVALPVEDLGLSLRFYIDALGLNVVRWEEGWAILRDPDTGQQLYLHELASHSHPALSLQCADFDAAIAHLEEVGAVEINREETPRHKHATMLDPDGHEIFLWWEA
jgi:predicted enzyme related to lactoylglutathione lyase